MTKMVILLSFAQAATIDFMNASSKSSENLLKRSEEMVDYQAEVLTTYGLEAIDRTPMAGSSRAIPGA